MERVIRRAILSVTDKGGLVDFARGLVDVGVELVSTGGTAAVLREGSLSVRDVADLTGAPEMMDGRVKTLHPRVHGGILADRADESHVAAMREHGIEAIDLVVVNLYRFEERVGADPGIALAEAVKAIDIGGPTMIRAAAKNMGHVCVVTSSEDYGALLAELRERKGAVSAETRRRLAAKAFRRCADYDDAIARWLLQREASNVAETSTESSDDAMILPASLSSSHERVLTMRYGENPHQAAALYRDLGAAPCGLFAAELHQGKAVSYNNLVDLEAAVELARDLGVAMSSGAPAGAPSRVACVIVKHTNPCGAAIAETGVEAYEAALASDPMSAFGGIVALDAEVDVALAERLAKIFVEVVVAKGFTPEALARFKKKKNLRVVTWRDWDAAAQPPLLQRPVRGGLLVQAADRSGELARDGRLVTARAPSEAEWASLSFAWTLVRYVKSNAIVLADGVGLLGVGAGQMSRVDAVDLAIRKASRSTKGAVMASDAFFPFKDNIERAAEAGISAIIQPGGSIRDEESIQAADAAGMAMVFTGTRHFRHL
jgi:phosphoribosylaminoimidazolecarboxamide formyltransferase / IMP cyclohydrolase